MEKAEHRRDLETGFALGFAFERELIVITRLLSVRRSLRVFINTCWISRFSLFIDLQFFNKNDHFSTIISAALEKPFAKLCDCLFPVVEYRIPSGCDIGC